MVCKQSLSQMPNWVHISVSTLLSALAESNQTIRNSLSSGEMVPTDIVLQIIEDEIWKNQDSDGIVIDGYPRDSQQVEEFEERVIYCYF